MRTGITNLKFIAASNKIGCAVSTIKAVDLVESKGSGFLTNGEVKILFEPHIFWKYLKKGGFTPLLSDVCYPKWGTNPYGSINTQHNRLQKAVKINRDIALMSASWGRFQIMGFNYKACGCKNIQDFINKMMESEESQLDLFVNYIISSNLDDELAGKDFKGFALQYNGPLYYKNNYDLKMKQADLKFAS